MYENQLIEQLNNQIAAIKNNIKKGKVNNIYAAQGKIRQIEFKINSIKHYNFLAQ